MAVPALLRSLLGLLSEKRAALSPFAAVGFCSSSHPASGARAQISPWTIPYRQRLGIGESPVVRRPLDPTVLEPPSLGDLKIQVNAAMLIGYRESRDPVFHMGSLTATAINSSGDILSFRLGHRKFEGKSELFNIEWRMQLYALRNGAFLAKQLEEEGKHIGPVIYETKHDQLLIWFGGVTVDGDEDLEESLRKCMPDDLDDLGLYDETKRPDELPEWIEGKIAAVLAKLKMKAANAKD